MEPLEDLFYELEAYTERRMPLSERAAFDQRLRSDADLQTALREYQLFRHSLDAIALKQQLNNLHDRLDQQGKLGPSPLVFTPGRWSYPTWMMAAASVVLVLIASVLYVMYQQPTLSEQTFMAFYHPEPTARGSDDCGPALTPGLQAYRATDYTGALRTFTRLPADQPCVHYYRGITQLAMGESDEAILNLKTARQTATGLIRQKADWYLALAYLRANQPDAARPLLDTLANAPGHPFSMVAQQAMNRMTP